MKTITYHYRGDIERTVVNRRSRNIEWREGYSADGDNGGVLYPWMTKTACRADAKAQDAEAVFVRLQ